MKKINYKTLLSATLDNFKSDGFYREFTPIVRQVESFPLTKVKFPTEKDKPKADLKIWCTNDYLNMSHNNQVIETMVEVIREVGTGSGGTRNISGTTPFHQNLESDLAKFHNRESALIFTSAYNANQTTIWTICKAFNNIPYIKFWTLAFYYFSNGSSGNYLTYFNRQGITLSSTHSPSHIWVK